MLLRHVSLWTTGIVVTLSLAVANAQSQTADLLIHVAGDSDNIVVDNGALQLNERQVTEMLAGMLYMAISQQSMNAYSIASNYSALQQQYGALPESGGCHLLALELHFDPSDQPNGRGQGLWVAVNESDQQANAIAQTLLDTWTSKKHSPYQGVALNHRQPAAYIDQSDGDNCPSIYLNVDTFTHTPDYSWFSHPQAIYYYANDLAHAILSALENNT